MNVKGGDGGGDIPKKRTQAFVHTQQLGVWVWGLGGGLGQKEFSTSFILFTRPISPTFPAQYKLHEAVIIMGYGHGHKVHLTSRSSQTRKYIDLVCTFDGENLRTIFTFTYTHTLSWLHFFCRMALCTLPAFIHTHISDSHLCWLKLMYCTLFLFIHAHTHTCSKKPHVLTASRTIYFQSL